MHKQKIIRNVIHTRSDTLLAELLEIIKFLVGLIFKSEEIIDLIKIGDFQ